jgi:hypothetical protein
MSCHYATFIETSDEKRESWYSFIRYDGNEDNLHHLQKQLESVEWLLLPNLSSFQLHLDPLVSGETARQMTKLKMNFIPHRRFDGYLRKINFGFDKNSDGNVTKLGKIHDTLKYGRIASFMGGDNDARDDYDDSDESIIDTDYESISSAESEDSNAPSSEVLQQLKDFLLT